MERHDCGCGTAMQVAVVVLIQKVRWKTGWCFGKGATLNMGCGLRLTAVTLLSASLRLRCAAGWSASANSRSFKS